MAKSLRTRLQPGDLATFVRTCAALASEAADEQGFVALRQLLARFQAELIVRPLLVEAMLAVKESVGSGTSSSASWALLLDSDTHRVSESDLKLEAYRRPLGARLRNTVAHELAHSLAFRPSEFGVKLESYEQNKESKRAFVQAVERETERLSPLLLLPETALAALFSRKQEPVTVDYLVAACRAYGVSRHLLINRLRLLRYLDPQNLLAQPQLRNIAILLSQRDRDGRVALRKWPVFSNFDGNIVPAFLHKLTNEDMLPLEVLRCDYGLTQQDSSLGSFEGSVDAGTPISPSVKKMQVTCCIEPNGTSTRDQMLFLVSAK